MVARYRSEPERLYLLPDDTVREHREWLKTALECPLEDCRDRTLIPRAMSNGRDHFAHRSGAGGHAPESVAHLQSKHLLRDWLERQDAVREVHVEERYGDTGTTPGTADVLAILDEATLGFEVQRSPLTPEAWLVRHRRYEQEGIGDTWVWVHRSKAHFRRIPREPGKLKLSSAQRETARHGLPLLWLNPERGEVLTGWVPRRPDEPRSDDPSFQVSPNGLEESCWVTADRLEDCAVDTQGLLTPTWRHLARQQSRLDAVNDDRARRRQRWKQAEAARRARMLTAAQREQAWLGSGLRQDLLTRYGTVPSVLRGKAGPGIDTGVWAHPEHWRAILYMRLVHGQPPGTRFTMKDCYRLLRRHDIPLHSPHKDIAGFLKRLASHHLVTLDRSGSGIDSVVVRRDLDTPPPPPPWSPVPPSTPTAPSPAAEPVTPPTTKGSSGNSEPAADEPAPPREVESAGPTAPTPAPPAPRRRRWWPPQWRWWRRSH